jgi:hypothetical protein
MRRENVSIIKQTGGSVNVGDEYLYDYITRDDRGTLRLFGQSCRVNDDGEVEAAGDPIDLTGSIDTETLAAWAARHDARRSCRLHRGPRRDARRPPA